MRSITGLLSCTSSACSKRTKVGGEPGRRPFGRERLQAPRRRANLLAGALPGPARPGTTGGPAMQFYMLTGGQRKGPFTIEQLAAEGLERDTPVWHTGHSDWGRADPL